MQRLCKGPIMKKFLVILTLMVSACAFVIPEASATVATYSFLVSLINLNYNTSGIINKRGRLLSQQMSSVR